MTNDPINPPADDKPCDCFQCLLERFEHTEVYSISIDLAPEDGITAEGRVWKLTRPEKPFLTILELRKGEDGFGGFKDELDTEQEAREWLAEGIESMPREKAVEMVRRKAAFRDSPLGAIVAALAGIVEAGAPSPTIDESPRRDDWPADANGD